MSIINEALKKAQKEKESFPAAHAATNIEVHFQKKHGLNWGPVFVLTVLFLIAGPILIPLFSTPFKNRAVTVTEKQPAVGQVSLPDTAIPMTKAPQVALAEMTRKAQFGIEEAPRPAPSVPLLNTIAAKSAFALSGIVYSPKDSYCIINDQIIKVGERVGGAKLLEITPDKVTLDYQGRLIALAQ